MKLDKLFKIIEEDESERLTVSSLFKSLTRFFEYNTDYAVVKNKDHEDNFKLLSDDDYVKFIFERPIEYNDTIDITMVFYKNNSEEYSVYKYFSVEQTSFVHSAFKQIHLRVDDGFVILNGFYTIAKYNKENRLHLNLKQNGNALYLREGLTIVYQDRKWVGYYNNSKIVENKDLIECLEEILENYFPFNHNSMGSRANESVITEMHKDDAIYQVMDKLLKHFNKAAIPVAKRGGLGLSIDFKYEGYQYLVNIDGPALLIVTTQTVSNGITAIHLQLAEISLKGLLSGNDISEAAVAKICMKVIDYCDYISTALQGFDKIIFAFKDKTFNKKFHRKAILSCEIENLSTDGEYRTPKEIHFHAIQKGADVEWVASKAFYDDEDYRDSIIASGSDPVEVARKGFASILSEGIITEIGYTNQEAVKGLKIKDEEWFKLDRELPGKLRKGNYGLDYVLDTDGKPLRPYIGWDVSRSASVYFYSNNKCVAISQLETTSQIDSTHISRRPGGWLPMYVEVRPSEQGKGLGKAMYKTLIVDIGLTMVSHESQTPSASRVWISLWKDPEILVYGTPYVGDGSEKWTLKVENNRLVPEGENSVDGMCLVAIER
jgi:hypothetical protein